MDDSKSAPPVYPVYPVYPDDADGDALRQVAANGSDMSRAMVIDFAIDAPSESNANACQLALSQAGYPGDIFRADGSSRWSVYCSITMVPDYHQLLRTIETLNQITSPHGGTADGWGTLGNGPDSQT